MSAFSLLDLTPDSTDEEISGAVEQAYKADYVSRRSFSLMWEEVLRFLEGGQWLSLRRGTAQSGSGWETTTPHSTRLGAVTQPRTNHVLPAVRALVSMLVKNLPRGTASPKDDDPSRVLARASEAVLEILDEQNKEAQKKALAALWGICCGTAIKKNIPEDVVPLGVEYVTPPGGRPLEDEDGNPVEVEGPPTEKRLCSHVLSPFQVIVDPSATEPDEITWIVETSVMPLSTIRTLFHGRDEEGNLRDGYTGRADEVTSEKSLSSPLNTWHRLKYFGPAWYSYAAGHGNKSGEIDFTDAAVVKECYLQPSVDLPEGLLAVVANGITLYKGSIPWLSSGRWHPYSFFRYFPFPGRFWAMGAGEHAVPIQRKINGIDAFIAIFRATMLAPKLLLPKGSMVSEDHITGVPGQIIQFNAAVGQPVVMNPGQLSSDIWNERKYATEELKFVTGTNDPLGGDRAEGVPSYSGQALLYERASDAHAFTHLEWEKFIEDDAACRLQFASMMLRDGDRRMERMVTEKLKFSREERDLFANADLADSVTIRVEAGSSVPRSRVLHQQGVFELAKAGQINLQDPEIRFRFLELFGAEEFEKEGHELRKAQLENAVMLDGNDANPLFLEEENHAIHMAAHMKSLVENAPRIRGGASPGRAWQSHLAHIALHRQAMMQQQMQDPAGAAGNAEAARAEMGPGAATAAPQLTGPGNGAVP